MHVIEVNYSGDVTIILKSANIKLTNYSSDPDCNLIKINNDSRVTLQLIGDNSLELNKRTGFQGGSQAAIEVCQNASLTIQSADNNDATGKLTVKSIGGNWGGAAIGSKAGSYDNVNRHEKAGAITINSGTIDAESREAAQGAAAIGGGVQGDATSIKINGGIITARGGDGGNTGAGIGGGGNKGAAGSIVINGGYIIAMGGTGGSTASGIGGGNGRNNHGTFSTGDNGHAVIIASSIGDQSKKESSWSGLIFEGSKGEIYGDSYTLAQDIEIPVEKTLEIKTDKTLTINEGITLTNKGTIKNAGTITGIVRNSESGRVLTKLTNDMITVSESVEYNGQAQTPVTIEGCVLNTDYTLSGSNNIDVAEATAENPPTVTVTPKEGGKLYGDPITKTFTIQRKSLSFTFTFDGQDVTSIPYDGREHEATVTPNVVGGDNVTTTLSYKKKEANDTFSDIGGKPKDAGTYKVIVSQISGEKASNYIISNTETEKSKTFTITQATNSWTTPLTMDGWTYSQTAQYPTAAAKFGSVAFSYSATEAGEYTETAPTTAGTWWVKASVVATNNYTGLESKKSFEIASATNSWTTPLTMEGWTYGETAKEPSAAAAQGNVSYTYYKKVADSEEYVSLDAKPTNAGTWYVKASVTGVANYNDLTSGYVEFVIAKATPTITLNVPTTAEDLIYDGNPKTVTASVSGVGLISTTVNLSYKVKDADDATYAETAPQNAGSYTVKASYDGDANHMAAEVTANFTIHPKTLTAEMVKLDSESFTYNGRAQQPNISATDADLSETITVTPTWSTEYTYTNVGTYNVTVTASGNYTGSTTKSYSITKATTRIADFSVADKIYDGNAIQVTAPKVTRGESAVEVADATLTFYQGETALTSAPVNAGSYTVKATYEGDANHKEAMKTANFTIQPKELTAEMIKLSDTEFIYNGDEQQPTVTVKDGNTQLTADTDYTLEWPQESKAAGSYTVKITGKSNYTGEKTMSYSIAKATPTYEVPAGLTATYGQTLAEVTLPNGWTWEEEDTTPVGDVGTNKFHAKFTPEDTDNYNVVEQVEVSILVSAADPNFAFSEPSLTITQGEEVPANALTKPEDCTVTYSSDNEKVATVDAETGEVTVVGVGTAIITATAGGNYSGTATYTLTVKAAYNPPSDPVYYTVTIPTEVTGAIIHDGGTHEVEAYTYLTFRIEIDPNGSGAYPQVTGLWGEILTPDSEGNYRLYVTGDTEVTIGEVPGCSYYLMTLPQETVEESDSTFWSAEGIEVVGAAAVPAMRASETSRFMAPFGTMVTLRPIETAERKFLQWENGSTERERTLTLRADEEIRALWQKVSAVSIEEIAANSLIRGERGQLCIEVPVSCDAVIYSYNGVPVRMAHLTEGSNRIYSLPAGLYLVQIGHARAVAVRVR